MKLCCYNGCLLHPHFDFLRGHILKWFLVKNNASYLLHSGIQLHKIRYYDESSVAGLSFLSIHFYICLLNSNTHGIAMGFNLVYDHLYKTASNYSRLGIL